MARHTTSIDDDDVGDDDNREDHEGLLLAHFLVCPSNGHAQNTWTGRYARDERS